MKTTRTLWISALLCALALPAGCASSKPAAKSDPKPAATSSSAAAEAPAEAPAQEEEEGISHHIFTGTIGSARAFEKYSVELGDERFAKALIDLRTNEIYYFDTNVYQMHSEFVFKHIYKEKESPDKLAAFLANYDEDKPEFLLLYILHHKRPGKYTFAFWEGDRMRPEHISQAYKRLKETFFAGEQLYFRPDAYDHREVALKVEGLPVLTNDDLYSYQDYQLFNEGRRVGKLRIIDTLKAGDRHQMSFESDEIILVNVPLPTLTVVSGIITEEFSTPLSHLGLRARAWGIPHIGLKNAAAAYGSLAGKIVLFEARADNHKLRVATKSEIAEWKAEKKKVRVTRIPGADLKQKGIHGLDEIRADEATAFGAKTANLGEIVHSKPEGYLVPPGLGVPIFYYQAHMKRHKLDKKVAKLLKDKTFKSDGSHRLRQLEELRAEIQAAKIDQKFLDAVIKKATAMGFWAEDKGMFIRSSTNAEDLPGFSGAGVYDTVPNVKGREALGEAIKQVWASVWNLEAYEEREFFGIDHTAVYGAVLVQVGVNPTAAGVLITAHTFDPNATTTYTINAKSGLGIRVVDGHKMPEQILFDYKTNTIRVVSRSDEDTMLVFDDKGGVKEVPTPEGKGEPVLTDVRAAALVEAARKVAKVFPEGPQDIEWLFEGDIIYIVQSRPYVTAKSLEASKN
ncbi:MAG: PEP/pyruvate-binding domain-containing protein [Myxococcota bacterium]|nr:PEP/pyruvate-binding domain-containing protein [Myxococcota bacterium]